MFAQMHRIAAKLLLWAFWSGSWQRRRGRFAAPRDVNPLSWASDQKGVRRAGVYKI